MLLVNPEIPHACEYTELSWLDRFGAHIHYPADCVRPVERRPRALQHLDPGNHLQRNREIQIEMPSLNVIDSQPVQQHQSLSERRAPNRKITLKPAERALLQIKR